MKKNIKAVLVEGRNVENLWIKNFDANSKTGIINNVPLSGNYKLNDKVKLLLIKERDYEYFKVSKKVKKVSKKVKKTSKKK